MKNINRKYLVIERRLMTIFIFEREILIGLIDNFRHNNEQ